MYQWSFDPKLLSLAPFQMTNEAVLTILKHIAAPTLFVRPLEGYPYSDDLMQKRLHSLKNLHYMCTPGGHHAHCDRPAENAKILQDFYQGLGLRLL
jgi:pimeloyl-ACP methyl ester carboxylesterase